jgi:hypothetical protein
MGRGKNQLRKAADSFTSVVGERRGLRQEQLLERIDWREREAAATNRRMKLVADWLGSNPHVPQEVGYIFDQVYQGIYPGSPLWDFLREGKNIHKSQETETVDLQGELDALVEQGFCIRESLPGEKVKYCLAKVEDWPQEQKDIFGKYMASV